MFTPKPATSLLLFLRLSAFFCFAGWTWVHFYWEGPYGILLWREGTHSLAERLGVGWYEFVGTGANDGLVQKWISQTGWLYLVCSVLALTVRKRSWIQMAVLLGGSGMLAVLSYAKYLSAQRQLPMFVEHGGQMLAPVILILGLTAGVRHRATIAIAIAATVMVFAGHGVYALGYHWPTPANFLGMTSIILHVESGAAATILRVAGAMDLLVCIGLFIPFLRRAAVFYALIWACLTAVARPVAGMSLHLNYWAADQFVHEAVLRAPHFMIPLYLLIVWRKTPSAVATVFPEKSSNPQICHPQEAPVS